MLTLVYTATIFEVIYVVFISKRLNDLKCYFLFAVVVIVS